MLRSFNQILSDISTDGITVWVNGATSLLGRFGQRGIDIHRPIEEQESLGECLHCTHGNTTKEDWYIFRDKMFELHGIVVSEEYIPKRFQ